MKFKNPWVSATQRLLTKEAEHALYEKAANDIELNNIHIKQSVNNFRIQKNQTEYGPKKFIKP